MGCYSNTMMCQYWDNRLIYLNHLDPILYGRIYKTGGKVNTNIVYRR